MKDWCQAFLLWTGTGDAEQRIGSVLGKLGWKLLEVSGKWNHLKVVSSGAAGETNAHSGVSMV
jgi:hypothetical protein